MSLRQTIYITLGVLVAICTALGWPLLERSVGELGEADLLREKIQLMRRLRDAAKWQAIERGVGTAIIAGDDELLEDFAEYGRRGDAEAAAAQKLARELPRSRAQIPLTTQLERWTHTLDALRVARSKVLPREVSEDAWLETATVNIRQGESALRDLVFAPTGPGQMAHYMHTLLLPHVSLLMNDAGLERAILAAALASRRVISDEQLVALEHYRHDRVDRSIEALMLVKELAGVPAEVLEKIERFEWEFLDRYEAVRSSIYQASAGNVELRREQRSRLQREALAIHEYLVGIVRDFDILRELPVLRTLSSFEAPNTRPATLALAKSFFSQFALLKKWIYSQVRYLHRDGWEWLRANSDGEVVSIPRDESLQNKQSRPYFRHSIRLDPREYYVSRLDLNVEHGEIQRPFQPMIRYAGPMHAGDAARGIVVLK